MAWHSFALNLLDDLFLLYDSPAVGFVDIQQRSCGTSALDVPVFCSHTADNAQKAGADASLSSGRMAVQQ